MTDNTHPPLDDATRALLRHTVATLAYRAGKVLRDVPDGFAEVRAAPASRSAMEILSHMVDLMGWAERLARGEYRWAAGGRGRRCARRRGHGDGDGVARRRIRGARCGAG